MSLSLSKKREGTRVANSFSSIELSVSRVLIKPFTGRRETGNGHSTWLWCSRGLDFMKIYRYPGTRARRQKTVRVGEKARYRLASRGEVGAGWVTVLQDAGRKEEKL